MKCPRSSKEERLASNQIVMGSNPIGDAVNVVYQEWFKVDQMGQHPNGASLHLSHEDHVRYLQKYWHSLPDDPPEEYDRPVGEAMIIDVSDDLYDVVKRSSGGARFLKKQRKAFKDEIHQNDRVADLANSLFSRVGLPKSSST